MPICHHVVQYKNHNAIFNSLHNSLQFFHWDQIHIGPRGTWPLGHYHLQLHGEGMSNHSHPLQMPCLQKGATDTRHTQRIHHRQQGGGQWLNSVYTVSVLVKCCATVGFVGTVYTNVPIKSSLWWLQQLCSYRLHTTIDIVIVLTSYIPYGSKYSHDKLQN